MLRGLYQGGPRSPVVRRAALLALALLVAGCARPDGPAPEPLVMEPPEGGGFAECPGEAAPQVAVPFRADAAEGAQGLGAGLHRLDDRTFLWVWASHEDTLREERVSRLNEVTVHRAADGTHVVCTRVEVVSETFVDHEPRSYDVAARFTAPEGMPPGPVRFVVNWAVGCECSPLPMGNTTATFP